jgi:L,D-transpeptidase ErfK/SrfK
MIYFAVFVWLSLSVSPSFNFAAGAEERPALANRVVGGQFQYSAQSGDSLTSIGARFGMDVPVLAPANNLDPTARLKLGQVLRIDNRHIVPQALEDGILINLPQRMLFYFTAGELVAHYPVGLGRPDWQTPTGRFTILTKEENPVWDVPLSIQEEMRREGQVVRTRVLACPQNPLGKHWMGLSIPGYGIHGTIAPSSIYQFRTHGCIRLHPDDMAALFAAVATGTPGLMVYQRLMVARVGEQIFLEVHRDVYRKEPNPLESLAAIARQEGLDSLLDWESAKEIIARQEGVAREVAQRVPLRRLP